MNNNSTDEGFYQEVIKYIFGDISSETWKRMLESRCIPPLPLPCHTDAMGLRRKGDEQAHRGAERYNWLLEQAWFQSAFERYDISDDGTIAGFAKECARVIDQAIKGTT